MKEFKNYLKENYPNNDYVLGPNWALIVPTQEELNEIDKLSFYHSSEKECILCHSKFKYGQKNKVICNGEKLILKCNYCGNFYEYIWKNNSGTTNNKIIDAIINKEKIIGFCSQSCNNMSRHSHGKCPTCGAEDVDIYNKRCTYYANRELNAPINCPIHGYQEKSFGGICIICHNQTEQMREQARKVGKASKILWQDKNFREKTEDIFQKRWEKMSEENKQIIKNNLNHKEFCEECNKITNHIGRVCTVCYPDSMPCGNKPNFTYEDVLYYKKEPVNGIIQKLESGEYDLKNFPCWNKRWCENCNKYEYHYETECLICGEINKLSNSNFAEKNGVKHYKNIEINEFYNKILSGEFNCNNYPGINIRFGHVCYGTEDIITGEHYYLSGSNFQLVEGVEFILNPMTGQREPSKEFYRRYQEKINSVNPSEEVQNLIDNEGFTLEPIITTGPDSWSKSRTDRYLSDKGYGWIVYIKLLNGHPWIVGKTGTMTVSKSPIDFDFTITDQRNPGNPDYAGPGREYARRYYPERIYSDFDSVLVKNFPCEQDTLIFEEFIAQEYGLFMS